MPHKLPEDRLAYQRTRYLNLEIKTRMISNNERYLRSTKGRFARLKQKAKARNIKVELTLIEISELVSQPCHYCGGNLNGLGYGLDRMDNDRHYVPDNLVPCCFPCNRIKGNLLTYDEMVVAMSAVLKFRAAMSKEATLPCKQGV